MYFDVLSLFLFIGLNYKLAFAENDLKPPEVVTENGRIEGTWKTSVEGRLFKAFEGVPYAEPPIGDLRFKEPRPRQPWIGTWKADKQYQCPQVAFLGNTGTFGEEDCLYLDVFVPKLKTTNKLNVLVYIHGGAYFAGSSSAYIDPKHLMDRDWILVSMNYRLGALGFLSTEDYIVPGNNGLKDQALALKWIQENIESFGGNPNSVTLIGFSAGAGSAHLHYFSPWSKGLYHRGWSFSGSAFNPWAIVENSLKKAQQLSTALGCDISTNEVMVECLRQRPADLIVKKTMDSMFPFPPVPYCPFAPVIEKGCENPFLREHPYKVLETGQANDVPWIASVVAQDATFVVTDILDKFDIINEKWTEVAKYLLDYVDTCPSSRESTVAEKIREFYLSKNGKFSSDTMEILLKMFTDRYFEMDGINGAQLQSRINKSPVYYSKFTYEGTNGWKKYYGIKYDKGTCHGDDLVYYLGALINQPMTDKEKELKNICLDILYSYATTGTPITKGVKWAPVGQEFMYLNITGPDIVQMEVKKDFSANQFWRDLNLLENENIFKLKDEL